MQLLNIQSLRFLRPGRSPATGDRDIITRMKTLRNLSTKAASSRKRDAYFPYLQRVRETDREFAETHRRERASIQMATIAGIKDPGRFKCPIFRIIIATSEVKPKAAAKMTQALRYAKLMNWSDLPRGLRANGGISGCAGKYADLRRRGKIRPRR